MVVDPATGEIHDESLDNSEGKSLEDIDIDALDISMKGTQDQMDFNIGTHFEVRQSTLKVPMLTKNVTGQYREGDTVKIEMEVEIDEITFKAIRDRSGNKIGVERIHKAIWE